ncbi:transporter associated domain-containing protein [Anaerosphaera multitolerans]|uniref:Transporter-associated domain-containing protein n=1 Tax=Anaerosphaera multitolerans TaxID=2487351 RepID=A0A437SAA3_9FIRM|nr:transporter associated domain-containing protein [Anaerosphaera multitolerans]RVU55734.1 hypothetical protein EF514_00535 [Anaerosphaera multitolerans]
MKRKKFLLLLNRIVFAFEILISLALVVGILISVPDIVRYYINILQSNAEISSILFKNFLSHVLLLVIAMEFVLLMVAHNDSTIIHLILLVISRKMLVESERVSDLLIGVIAIAILFAVRKYLLVDSSDVKIAITRHRGLFTTGTHINDINHVYEFDIDDQGFETLGELVFHLFNSKGEEIELNGVVDDGRYYYEIKSVEKGNVKNIEVYNVK